MIPKIIHYCWLSDDPVPELLQKYMKTWKEKLPDYEFMLWNFERFDKTSSLWVSQAFDNKKYAFAADYIRLFAVYNHGGIYMDMDIEVLRNFDDLLDSDLLLAYEDDYEGGIEAGCFGASKHNVVIRNCLEYYENRGFVKDDGSFDMLPLPKIMIQYIRQYPELSIKNRYFFTCKSYFTGEITKKEFSYAIHHFAGSWTSPAQQTFVAARRKLIDRFGTKIGAFLSLPAFCMWQIQDNGLKGFALKIWNKIKG